MKEIKSPEEIVREYYSCTCDKMYKDRKMTDPNCILCEHGTEMELIAKAYHSQFAVTSEEVEKAKKEFVEKWDVIKLNPAVKKELESDLDHLLELARKENKNEPSDEEIERAADEYSLTEDEDSIGGSRVNAYTFTIFMDAINWYKSYVESKQ